jgi:integrase
MPIASIKRSDIAPHLAGPPVAAARARTRLMTLCKWAIEQGYLDVNPAVGTTTPDKHIRPRERVLSAPELVAIWNGCDQPYAFDTIVKLLMLTGARRQEVGSMAHAELDRSTGIWTISGERAKNHRDHPLPLPPLAWDLIDAWVRRGALPDRLFSRKGFKAWATNERALDARCGVEG